MQNNLEMAGHGASFFPTDPDLANILGRTGFNFDQFYFLFVLDPTFPDVQVPRFPNCPWALFTRFVTGLQPWGLHSMQHPLSP